MKIEKVTPYEYIKQQIIDLKLQPGELVQEAVFAEELHISKIPVREAFRKLEAEGLLNIYPHRGAFVTPLSLSEAESVCDLRTLLEVWAVRKSIYFFSDEETDTLKTDFLAATIPYDREKYDKVDRAFHAMIIDKTGILQLQKMYHILSAQIQRYRAAMIPGLDGRLVHDQHLDLLEAIRNREEDKAAALLQSHLEDVKKRLLHTLNHT